MNKLRLSYTLLSLWYRGDVDAAVQTYFHMERPITEQMEEGKEIHNQIAEHIEKKGQFPDWFFPVELENPEPEKEVVVSYNEYFDLKCYMDCLDNGILYEYKTGVTDSLEWARSDQLPLYFLIAELGGLTVVSGYLIHYNQYLKEVDFAIVHNTQSKRDRARELIDSAGPEIYEYFVTEGLI